MGGQEFMAGGRDKLFMLAILCPGQAEPFFGDIGEGPNNHFRHQSAMPVVGKGIERENKVARADGSNRNAAASRYPHTSFARKAHSEILQFLRKQSVELIELDGFLFDYA
ncbi:hypothetical protein [Labrenzia sp. CE80]|uniref:hypothetical protein n=1 Tax=Labrenzia sp. CE80 TaxID=1788986 RepID=UPI00129BD347|nr:hypothetical protein [Labrenzia sp. CE80]